MNPNKFFWGVLIIIIGLLFLAGNMGLIPTGFWLHIWRFWPLVLIILGVGLIFSKEKRGFWFLALMVFVMLLLTGGLVWWAYTLPEPSLNKTQISEDYFNNVSSLEVDINYGAANLSLAETVDNKALTGSINSFGEPSISTEVSNGKEKIVVNQLKEGPRLWGSTTGKNSLDLKVIDRIPLDLNINTGASKFDLDLEKIKLNRLDINCGASSGNIKIGQNQKEITIIIKSGASNFNLSLPKDAGLNIYNKSGLSSSNFEDIGLKKNDRNFKSDNFDAATQKINISFETGASSIKIEQY